MNAAASSLIRITELGELLGRADLRVVDCRFDLANPDAGRETWLDSHIPGAVFADLNNDLAAPVTEDTGRHPLPVITDIEEVFGRLGIDQDTTVVVYDAGNGAMAARCWWLLKWLGHDSVRLLDGGFEAWMASGAATESGEVQAPPAAFTASVQPGLVVTTAELVEQFDEIEALRLVDARDAVRFRGDVEPIDPVAGHVPGAMNLPLTESIGADGLWRSRDELETVWRHVLGEGRDQPWIAMCGSGVTACHIALSAVEAGYRMPRLYAGSWSEWIRDPDRPVGVGNP